MTTSELPAPSLPRVSTSRPASGSTSTSASAYRVRLATDAADVLAAQRLRFTVFETECGARTPGPPGLDADRFDDLSDHLIVCHDALDGSRGISSGGEVVATYRLLPPHANDAFPRGAGLYAGGEFDLTPLEPVLDRTVEAGRCCVAAEHRGAAPISLLWAGITRYLAVTGYRYLLGCTSLSLADGGGTAAGFADLARTTYAAPERFWCTPAVPFDAGAIVRPDRLVLPPLLRGYLRLGAVMCGPPALDPEFGTADFLTLVDLETADARYLRFFGAHAPADLFDRA